MSPGKPPSLAVVVIIIYTVIGGYIGVAGWHQSRLEQQAREAAKSTSKAPVVYKGLSFASNEDAEVYKQQELIERWYPWIEQVPIPILVAILGFAMIGGVAALLRKIFIDRRELRDLPYVAEPLFACFMGVMVFFLSFILPAALTLQFSPGRPEVLIGIALFCGVFSEQAFEWMKSTVVDRIFTSGGERAR